jgi:hypothetical protein
MLMGGSPLGRYLTAMQFVLRPEVELLEALTGASMKVLQIQTI